jgi:hypothetical protein
MSHPVRRFLLALASFALLPACIGTDSIDLEATDDDAKPFASAQAKLVDFQFDGELTAPWQTNTTKLVKDQLFYMVGQLNAHRSLARLDQAVITNVVKTSNGADGWMKVTYRVTIPVGWGNKLEVPSTFAMTLPRRIGPQSLTTFTTTYAPTCSDEPASANSGNFWYHFRPEQAGCTFAAADAVKVTAKVTESAANTTGKFPEYDEIWKDGSLRVVAVFGKYADYATSQSDAGIAAYNEFVDTMRTGFGAGLTTTPASLPVSPGVAAPDVTFKGKIGGKDVSVTALLIDSPKVATAAFDARYAELTKTADLVAYNGHAGLGANVRALANKGSFVKGQYVVFFMNGCDTFAYLDNTLANRFAALNPGDTKGTKHLDMLVNLMPAYFHAMPDALLALVSGLGDPEKPKTYEQIFTGIDAQQVVVVTGEEDNDFVPSAQPFDGFWTAGLLDRGAAHRYDTGVLPAGTYTIRVSETNPGAPGDVDLYVGVGYAPTTDNYDEAPYLYGSDEEVEITLHAPSVVHVLLHAWDEGPAQSGYELDIE